MKKALIFTLCLTFFQSNCLKNIVQISIPKTGTFLLYKCIALLTGLENQSHFTNRNPDPENFAKECREGKYWVTHTYFNEEFLPFLNNDQSAIFFIYRDPRDQLVSAVYYRERYAGRSEEEAQPFFDEHLLSIIQGTHNYKGIDRLYRCYLPWMFAPHVCVIRFEDLVGPKGGGDSERQYKVVKKIADHLGLDITEERINQVCDELFGRELFGRPSTFRKGQIGQWKTHFKKYHKEAFKEIADQLLIDLGYERNLDW